MHSFPESQNRKQKIAWSLLVDPLLIVTVTWCIFSFKIFLISFGEAGMRPDDLLILASFVALVVAGRVRRTPISLPLKVYFVYIAIEFVSAAWNGFLGRVGFIYSLVFVLRLLEYLAFYFIGYSLARSHFRTLQIARGYAYTLCALVPLQMLGLVPIPGVFGRSRASGNTNGPYELAVVCGFLLCFVAYRKRSVFIGAASLALIVLTASRITLIASVLSLIHFGLTKTRSLGTVIGLTTAVIVIGSGLYLTAASGLVSIGAFDRLQNSSSLGIADAQAVYDAAPVAKNATDYMEGSFQDLNGLDTGSFDGDMSGLIRFTRWLTLLKTNLSHVDAIVIGLGPSFGSSAVDGYYTRCFVETGALGLLAFLAFLAMLLFARRGSNWYFREYVLIMVVSSIFIDVFLSYKSMLLLWLWHGINQYRRGRASDPAILPPTSLTDKPTLVSFDDNPSTGSVGAL